MSTLKFEFTIDETNVILGSLSKQPFEFVSGLITKIQQQAGPQLPPPTDTVVPATAEAPVAQ